MDHPVFPRIAHLLMRQAQGKNELPPIEYFDLCECHPEERYRPRKGISVERLRKTADEGCSMCRIVQRGLETILGTPLDDTYNVNYKLKKGAIKLRYRQGHVLDTQKEYQVYTAKGTVTFAYIKKRPGSDVSNVPNITRELGPCQRIHKNPISSECIASIREMLRDCRDNHAVCQRNSLCALPTRVLHVGSQGQSQVFLHCENKKAEYVALSHCWGSAQNLTTTTITLQERQNGIEWDVLPKTFQDAIRITRELGFEYLWIDSLCILQDSHEDWEREAAVMGSVYENAALTIAASVAKSDTAGFLESRHEHLDIWYEIQDSKLENGVSEFYIRDRLPKHKRHDIASRIRNPWRSNVLELGGPLEPLDYRAWTFQERLVSRRLLSFCGREYEWDCLSGTNCECGERRRDFALEGWDARNGSMRQVYQSLLQENLGAHEFMLGGRDSYEMTMDLAMRLNAATRGCAMTCGRCADCKAHSEKPTKEDVRERAYTLWRTHLVPAYSQLRLTKPMDRLPALQALARNLSPMCGEYIAGVWKEDLTVAIAWICKTVDSSGPQPGLAVNTRAPTWSWASIEGAVDHCLNFEDDFKIFCELARVHIIPDGCDGFSNFDFAVAGMRGHLLPATLEVRASDRAQNGEVAQNGTSEYLCRIGEETFSMYPDCLLEEIDGEVERSDIDTQEEISCLISVMACLIIRDERPRKSRRSISAHNNDDDGDDDDWYDVSKEKRLIFLALNRYEEDESALPYRRIGILPFVKWTKLPDKWYERWPAKIFLLS